jgi:hypothetical protein
MLLCVLGELSATQYNVKTIANPTNRCIHLKTLKNTHKIRLTLLSNELCCSSLCMQIRVVMSVFSPVLAILINLRRQKIAADISKFGGSSAAIFLSL